MDNKSNSNPDEKSLDLDSLISYYKSTDDSKKADNLNHIHESVPAKIEKSVITDSDKTIVENDKSLNNVNVSSSGNAANSKRKFVVHIDDDDLNFSDSSSQKPADNSSVYFSNYKGINSHVVKQNEDNTKDKILKNSKEAKNHSENNNKKSKNKRTVGGRFAIILFALIIVITSVFSYISITTVNDVLAVTSSDESVEVSIYKKNAKGEDDKTQTLTYDEIIDILSDKGLVKQNTLCKLFAKFRKFDDPDYKFKPGIYTFKRNMGVEGMLYKCLQQNKSAETITVSFPEGWTITQMFEKLEKNKVCTAKSLYAVLDSYLDMHINDFAFLKDVPNKEDRYQIFEGYLFPDTYDFYVESDPNFVISKLFNSFNSHWTEEYQKQAAKLGYSMDEIITIASIIQKEAADSSQMKNVSSVIHNRLQNPTNYPSIGCDSTYDYISNNYDSSNFALSQKTYYLNQYSTETNQGLPPGPISNPGSDAIEAALYPANTNYYFFQHDKFGKIYLAATKSQFDYDYSVVQRVNNED